MGSCQLIGCVIISDCWTHSDGLGLMCEKSNTVLRFRHHFWQLNAFRWNGSDVWEIQYSTKVASSFLTAKRIQMDWIWNVKSNTYLASSFFTAESIQIDWIWCVKWNPILRLHHHFIIFRLADALQMDWVLMCELSNTMEPLGGAIYGHLYFLPLPPPLLSGWRVLPSAL